jgi:hypothetical protein
MRKLALLAALLVLALPAARADAQATVTKTQTYTKTQAYKAARACLRKSGKVRLVGRRADGGGYAFFKRYRHIVYWSYHTDNFGRISRVIVNAFRLPAAPRRVLRHCTYVP